MTTEINERQIENRILTYASFKSDLGYWDETASYSTGDLVRWKGKIYKATTTTTAASEGDVTNNPEASGDWVLVFDPGSSLVRKVSVLSDSNIDLTQTVSTIDGVSLSTGVKVFLAGQSDTTQNGYYEVDSSSKLVRESKLGDHANLDGTAFVVMFGTEYAKTFWIVQATDEIPQGNITATPISGAGANYQFTNGLTEVGGTVKLGGTLTEDTTIDNATNNKRFVIGKAGGTEYSFDYSIQTHNFHTVNSSGSSTVTIMPTYITLQQFDGTDIRKFELSQSDGTVTATKYVLQYADDYHNQFGDRSIADKAYIDFRSHTLTVTVFSGSNVDLSNAPLSIDGVTLAVGDTVALFDQSTTKEDGIYIVSNVGSSNTTLARWSYTPAGFDLSGYLINVLQGSTYANKSYFVKHSAVLGTDDVTYYELHTPEYTFENGLTESSGVVKLGGSIISDTTLDTTLSGKTLTLLGASHYIQINPNLTIIGQNDNSTDIQVYVQFQNSIGSFLLEDYSGSVGKRRGIVLNKSLNGIQVIDTEGSYGLYYESDYHSNFSDRSIPDKGYVDFRSRVIAVNVLSDSNVDPTAGPLTIDGKTLAKDDLVALFNQTTDTNDGIYIVTSVGSSNTTLTRWDYTPIGFDLSGFLVSVLQGTNYGNKLYFIKSPAKLGTDGVNYFTASAVQYTFYNGLVQDTSNKVGLGGNLAGPTTISLDEGSNKYGIEFLGQQALLHLDDYQASAVMAVRTDSSQNETNGKGSHITLSPTNIQFSVVDSTTGVPGVVQLSYNVLDVYTNNGISYNGPTYMSNTSNNYWVPDKMYVTSHANIIRVDVRATGNIDLTNVPSTIDGVTITTGMTVGLFNQSTADEDGIYTANVVSGTVHLDRHYSFPEGESIKGRLVYVFQGTTYAGKIFKVTNTANSAVLGTNDISLSEYVSPLAPPPGSNKQIIFNDNNSWGADAGLYYDKSSTSLYVGSDGNFWINEGGIHDSSNLLFQVSNGTSSNYMAFMFSGGTAMYLTPSTLDLKTHRIINVGNPQDNQDAVTLYSMKNGSQDILSTTINSGTKYCFAVAKTTPATSISNYYAHLWVYVAGKEFLLEVHTQSLGNYARLTVIPLGHSYTDTYDVYFYATTNSASAGAGAIFYLSFGSSSDSVTERAEVRLLNTDLGDNIVLKNFIEEGTDPGDVNYSELTGSDAVTITYTESPTGTTVYFPAEQVKVTKGKDYPGTIVRLLDEDDLTTIDDTFVKKSGDTMTGVLKMSEVNLEIDDADLVFHDSADNYNLVLQRTSTGQLQMADSSLNLKLSIGSANSSWCHFNADAPRFYFNKDITSATGTFSAYDGKDLQLRLNTTPIITALSSNSYVGINTDTPVEQLDVAGWIRSDSGHIINRKSFSIPASTTDTYYRIGTGTSRVSGVYIIRWQTSGYHGEMMFAVGDAFGDDTGFAFNMIYHIHYNVSAISKVRFAENGTYDTMYLDVLMHNTSSSYAMTVEVIQLTKGHDGFNMPDTLTTADALATGYTAHEFSTQYNTMMTKNSYVDNNGTTYTSQYFLPGIGYKSSDGSIGVNTTMNLLSSDQKVQYTVTVKDGIITQVTSSTL